MNPGSIPCAVAGRGAQVGASRAWAPQPNKGDIMDQQKIEPAKVRAWALEQGKTVGKRGRLDHKLVEAYVRDMQHRTENQ